MYKRIFSLLLLINLTVFKSFLFAEDAKIAFLTTSLCYGGTDIALFDYADFNEKILGNTSYIFSTKNNHPIKEKYQSRFGNRCYLGYDLQALEDIILKENIQIVYTIKSGEWDGILFQNAKNAIHAVFSCKEPHGDAFALISDWLNERFQANFPVVPHMIHLDTTKETLRKELNIPESAIVFGRHGSKDQFDLKYAQKAVIQTVLKNKNIFFVFLNTDPFYQHDRIIYLPPTTDMKYKTKFINTCDAMIHGRSIGETFGLACGEFSIRNKPVITWANGVDKAHIKILGPKGIYYKKTQDLRFIFENFVVSSVSYDAYSEKYNPKVVMKTFDEVFIKPLLK